MTEQEIATFAERYWFIGAKLCNGDKSAANLARITQLRSSANSELLSRVAIHLEFQAENVPWGPERERLIYGAELLAIAAQPESQHI